MDTLEAATTENQHAISDLSTEVHLLKEELTTLKTDFRSMQSELKNDFSQFTRTIQMMFTQRATPFEDNDEVYPPEAKRPRINNTLN